MTELPEVETIHRDLEREVVGKRVKTVDIHLVKAVARSGNKTKFAAALDGAKITVVDRRGLWLLATLDNDVTLVIHLGQKGRLLRTANKAPLDKKTIVVIGFTQSGQLRLVDESSTAQIFTVPTADLDEKVPELGELGLDPIEQPISWVRFGEMLLTHRLKLKALLTDDAIITGIGDVYSDEILFNAGLRYDRLSDSLSTQEYRRFYRSLVETLHDAVKYRGSTLDDNGYVDLFGKPGSYQDHHNVYRKDGELSPRSRRPIVKAKFGKGWTYYCDQSQV